MDPFIGQIKMFGGNFAPRGFTFCNGQLLPIAQNTALFSILGTTYGGDGRTTFGMPDLQGRGPMHRGQGPGLSNRPLGAKSGQQDVALAETSLPSHTHQLMAVPATATTPAPASNTGLANTAAGGRGGGGTTPYAAAANLVAMEGSSLGNQGENAAHSNVQPRLGINYIIALQGVFPSRN